MAKKKEDVATQMMKEVVKNSKSNITAFPREEEEDYYDAYDEFDTDCDGVGRTSEGFRDSYYGANEFAIYDASYLTDKEQEKQIKKLQKWCSDRLESLKGLKSGDVVMCDFGHEVLYGLVVDFGRYCKGCGGRKQEQDIAINYETMHEFRVTILNQMGTPINMWLDEFVEMGVEIVEHDDKIGDSIVAWIERWM